MQQYQKYYVNKSVVVEQLLQLLFEALDEITNKDYLVEQKTNSLHIVKGSAFLGVHFLKDALRLNIVLNHSIKTDLPYKLDKPSANVFHNRVDLSKTSDLQKVIPFIKEAYKIKLAKYSKA